MRPPTHWTAKPSSVTSRTRPEIPSPGTRAQSKMPSFLPPKVVQAPGEGLVPADQVVDLLDRLVPVDARMPGGAAALVGRLVLVGDDARRIALAEQVDHLEHAVDGVGIDLLEVQIDHGVVRLDRAFPLQQAVALVETIGWIEPAVAGLGRTHDDRPVDRGGTAVQRQQRGMEADRPVRRGVARRLGNEDVDEGHDHEVGVVPLQGRQRRLLVEIGRLLHRQALFERELLDRIDRLALLVGLTIDGDDLVGTRVQKFCQDVLAEGLLSHHDQTHSHFSPGRPALRRARSQTRNENYSAASLRTLPKAPDLVRRSSSSPS